MINDAVKAFLGETLGISEVVLLVAAYQDKVRYDDSIDNYWYFFR